MNGIQNYKNHGFACNNLLYKNSIHKNYKKTEQIARFIF